MKKVQANNSPSIHFTRMIPNILIQLKTLVHTRASILANTAPHKN